jgi:hypothetical protein
MNLAGDMVRLFVRNSHAPLSLDFATLSNNGYVFWDLGRLSTLEFPTIRMFLTVLIRMPQLTVSQPMGTPILSDQSTQRSNAGSQSALRSRCRVPCLTQEIISIKGLKRKRRLVQRYKEEGGGLLPLPLRLGKEISAGEFIAVFAVERWRNRCDCMAFWATNLLYTARRLDRHSRRKRATFVLTRQDVVAFRASMNTYSRK